MKMKTVKLIPAECFDMALDCRERIPLPCNIEVETTVGEEGFVGNVDWRRGSVGRFKGKG